MQKNHQTTKAKQKKGNVDSTSCHCFRMWGRHKITTATQVSWSKGQSVDFEVKASCSVSASREAQSKIVLEIQMKDNSSLACFLFSFQQYLLLVDAVDKVGQS